MKLLKYYLGSLIISLGLIGVIAIVVASFQVQIPSSVAKYFVLVWLGLAVVLLPFAKKIMRV